MSGARDTVAELDASDLFRGLERPILEEIAARTTSRRFEAGKIIVAELEPGFDVYVITEGNAVVTVAGESGERRTVAELSAGGTIGEMASVTGELRSATVTAKTAVDVLVVSDADFDWLRERCPEVALRVVRMLARRLAEAERMGEALLTTSGATSSATGAASSRGDAPPARRGSLARIWRELVVSHERDLPFATLGAFVVTLLVIRGVVFAAFRFDFAPRDVLRTAYLTGFALLIGSACTSLLTFRPSVRRAIAVAYGVGAALVFNEARRHARVRHLLQGHPHARSRRALRHRAPLSPHGADSCDRHRARGALPGCLPATVLSARGVRDRDAREAPGCGEVIRDRLARRS